MNTKILWLSRHAATPVQIMELNAKFGAGVPMIHETGTVKDGAEVKGLMEKHGATEIVAVLPPPILSDLLRLGVKPIRAKMQRIATGEMVVNRDTGKEEPGFRFEFESFERILKVEVVTEPL